MEDEEYGTATLTERFPGLTYVLVGAALLTAGSLAMPRLIGHPAPAMLFGGFVGAAILFWGIALLAGLRRGALLWVLGALVLLVAVSGAAAMGAERQFAARESLDASSFAEAEFGPDGVIQLPAGAAARGPVSKAYADMLAADVADRRAFDAALGEARLGGISSPYALEQDPSVLTRCDATAKAKAVAAENSKKRIARRAETVAAVDSAGLPESLDTGMRQMVLAGHEPGGEDPLLAIHNELLAATGDMCRLLAKKSWVNQYGRFGFRNPADLATFDALSTRLRNAVAALSDVMRSERSAIEEGREGVRDALS